MEIKTHGKKHLNLSAPGHIIAVILQRAPLAMSSAVFLVCFLAWICQVIASIICFPLAVESWPGLLFLFLDGSQLSDLAVKSSFQCRRVGGSQLSDLEVKSSFQCRRVGKTHTINFHRYCDWCIILLSVYAERSYSEQLVLKQYIVG